MSISYLTVPISLSECVDESSRCTYPCCRSGINELLLGPVAAAVCSVAVGSSMVVHANLNIGLGVTLGSPVRASCVSFLVGLLFVSALNVISIYSTGTVSTESVNTSKQKEEGDKKIEAGEVELSLYRIRIPVHRSHDLWGVCLSYVDDVMTTKTMMPLTEATMKTAMSLTF